MKHSDTFALLVKQSVPNRHSPQWTNEEIATLLRRYHAKVVRTVKQQPRFMKASSIMKRHEDGEWIAHHELLNALGVLAGKRKKEVRE